MTKTFTHHIAKVTEHQKALFWCMMSLILVVSFFYGYFVKETIMNVVAREHAMTDSRTLNSEISDLESSYIAAKNDVTLELAYSKGFEDASNVNYISLKNSGKTLSFNR